MHKRTNHHYTPYLPTISRRRNFLLLFVGRKAMTIIMKKENNFEQVHSYQPPRGGYGKPSIDNLEEEYDDKFNLSNVCSTTDCTGLIQNVPLTDSELESYRSLYSYEASEAVAKKTKKKD